jgi:nicotinamide riboside kinase
MIKKIVAIGPESTGKSTLCEQLAQQYDTIWCPEYAREYLHQNGVKYVYDDLEKIAQGQLLMEDHCVELVKEKWSLQDDDEEKSNLSEQQNMPLAPHHSPLLFIDTNMYVMKVWYEYVFKKCAVMVLNEIAARQYDLYLLCNIDLPWTADEMREYPDKKQRTELYQIYKDLLIQQSTPWVEISGNYEERLQKAVEAVNGLL